MAAIAQPRLPGEGTTPSSPSSPAGKWMTPSLLPNSLFSLLNPFASGAPADNGEQHEATSTPAHGNSEFPLASTPQRQSSTTAKDPPSPSRSLSVMFAEPESRSTSDAGSREGSVDGGGDAYDGHRRGSSAARSRRRRQNSGQASTSGRPKTQFSICHPPPTSVTRSKFHRRPRSLLQLHRLSAHARPLPAFEVIPSANFSVRLGRAITKVFKARHGLCPNDLVILRAEKYHAAGNSAERDALGEEESEDNESTAERDVIGLICKDRSSGGSDEKSGNSGSAGKMRIHVASSGREWDAYGLPGGGYEFFSTDEHGLAMTLRWVPKRDRDGAKATLPDGSRRFNFSPIALGTRRHPVVASLSRTALDVYDTYRLPDPNSIVTPLGSAPKQTPSGAGGSSILADVLEEELTAAAARQGQKHRRGREGSGASSTRITGGVSSPTAPSAATDVLVTDDDLREIITLTAIWVAFKEGWSPSFKYDDTTNLTTSSQLPAGSSPSKIGILTETLMASSNLGVATPPGSPMLSPADSKRASMKSLGESIVRRTSLLGRSASKRLSLNSDNGGVLAEWDAAGGGMSSQSPTRSGSESRRSSAATRARADSTGTVLVHRTASQQRRSRASLQVQTVVLAGQQSGSPALVSSPVPISAGGNVRASWNPDLRAVENDIVESRASREEPAAARGPAAGSSTTWPRKSGAARRSASDAAAIFLKPILKPTPKVETDALQHPVPARVIASDHSSDEDDDEDDHDAPPHDDHMTSKQRRRQARHRDSPAWRNPADSDDDSSSDSDSEDDDEDHRRETLTTADEDKTSESPAHHPSAKQQQQQSAGSSKRRSFMLGGGKKRESVVLLSGEKPMGEQEKKPSAWRRLLCGVGGKKGAAAAAASTR